MLARGVVVYLTHRVGGTFSPRIMECLARSRVTLDGSTGSLTSSYMTAVVNPVDYAVIETDGGTVEHQSTYSGDNGPQHVYITPSAEDVYIAIEYPTLTDDDYQYYGISYSALNVAGNIAFSGYPKQ